MRSVFWIALLFSIFFGVSFWYGKTADVCPVPIKYSIGNIDKRFGLDKAELKEVLFKSESVWEDFTQRELFVYDDKSPFTVNLIYDDRQQLVHTEDELRAVLDKQETESKAVLDKVEEVKKQYELIKDKYLKQKEDYESRLEKYNNQVDLFNKSGGAPTEQFEKLNAEQKELSGLLDDLLKTEKGLNKLVDEINGLNEKGKELVDVYNTNVKKYNEIFGNLDPITQGDFQREGINIYKFKDKEELSRVIVHEFGHALGIKHVEGEDSIMYYLMTEQSGPVILSDEDKAAIRMICGDQKDFSSEVRSFIRNLLVIVKI